MDPHSLTAALAQEAARLGFCLAGACPAVAPPEIGRFRRWLERGYAGQMQYMSARAPLYEHPRHVLKDAKSIFMLGMKYATCAPAIPAAGQGAVSRYAWGIDYHDLIHERLDQLADFHRRLVPGAQVRGVVDTAPLLEREFAQLAGLGWIGKNTLLINRREGSWLFLAALLTDSQLSHAAPQAKSHCGTCRACLEACPTGALIEPGVLDSRKCVSYLSIELRSSIPQEFRPAMGDRLFGCDACQEVCPWNRQAPPTGEPGCQPREGMNPVELAGLFTLDDEAFRRRFRGTSLTRAKRGGVLRNAAIVLGNRPDAAAVPALIRGLNDGDPLVRGTCAWALGRYHVDEARNALAARLAIETDAEVRQEIQRALK
ncbi:MAG: tRNA epoxyqueuosine(34) reductase QueG [Pirellulales bacterium]